MDTWDWDHVLRGGEAAGAAAGGLVQGGVA